MYCVLLQTSTEYLHQCVEEVKDKADEYATAVAFVQVQHHTSPTLHRTAPHFIIATTLHNQHCPLYKPTMSLSL